MSGTAPAWFIVLAVLVGSLACWWLFHHLQQRFHRLLQRAGQPPSVPRLDPTEHTAGERIAAAIQAFHEHKITLVVLADEIDDALTSYR